MAHFPNLFKRGGDKMNRFKTFRSRFDKRMNQLQDAADQIETTVRDGASTLAEQTREGLAQGQKTFSSWEKSLERSMRAYPMVYAGGILVLIGLLIASMLGRKR